MPEQDVRPNLDLKNAPNLTGGLTNSEIGFATDTSAFRQQQRIINQGSEDLARLEREVKNRQREEQDFHDRLVASNEHANYSAEVYKTTSELFRRAPLNLEGDELLNQLKGSIGGIVGKYTDQSLESGQNKLTPNQLRYFRMRMNETNISLFHHFINEQETRRRAYDAMVFDNLTQTATIRAGEARSADELNNNTDHLIRDLLGVGLENYVQKDHARVDAEGHVIEVNYEAFTGGGKDSLAVDPRVAAAKLNDSIRQMNEAYAIRKVVENPAQFIEETRAGRVHLDGPVLERYRAQAVANLQKVDKLEVDMLQETERRLMEKVKNTGQLDPDLLAQLDWFKVYKDTNRARFERDKFLEETAAYVSAHQAVAELKDLPFSEQRTKLSEKIKEANEASPSDDPRGTKLQALQHMATVIDSNERAANQDPVRYMMGVPGFQAEEIALRRRKGDSYSQADSVELNLKWQEHMGVSPINRRYLPNIVGESLVKTLNEPNRSADEMYNATVVLRQSYAQYYPNILNELMYDVKGDKLNPQITVAMTIGDMNRTTFNEALNAARTREHDLKLTYEQANGKDSYEQDKGIVMDKFSKNDISHKFISTMTQIPRNNQTAFLADYYRVIMKMALMNGINSPNFSSNETMSVADVSERMINRSYSMNPDSNFDEPLPRDLIKDPDVIWMNLNHHLKGEKYIKMITRDMRVLGRPGYTDEELRDNARRLLGSPSNRRFLISDDKSGFYVQWSDPGAGIIKTDKGEVNAARWSFVRDKDGNKTVIPFKTLGGATIDSSILQDAAGKMSEGFATLKDGTYGLMQDIHDQVKTLRESMRIK